MNEGTSLKACVLMSIFLLGMACVTAAGRTIYVDDDGPADFNNIQAAIDDANGGDTVLVADGTYTGDGNENIDFKGKAITLRSKNGPGNCIIDCNAGPSHYGRGFYLHRGEDADSVLDGFTITNGYQAPGGGICCNPASPTIANCWITNNQAILGRSHFGGGIYCSPINSTPTIYNCIISGNSAGHGGGIGGGARITNCEISNNWTQYDSSGVGGAHSIKYCTISGNTSGKGSVVSAKSITNCTIIGNKAGEGDRLYWCSGSFTNSIIWYNLAEQIGDCNSVTYSNVQGGCPGAGNIDVDPCFAEPGYWDLNGTVQDPNDDFWVEGDYHLKSQAGRWEPMSESWVQDDVTSPCIDTGGLVSPIGNEPFPNGGRINMGAFGGTAEASKSYFGGPPCEIIVAGDVNGDCIVNYLDFRIIALHWLERIEPNQGQWHLVEDDTEDSYSCEGNFDVSYPCSNAVDEDWDTYALKADSGGTSYIYENYIIPTGITMAEFTIKYRQTAAVTPGLCTNVTDYWDGSTWKELNCTALTTQISTLTVRIPDDALSRSTLQLRTPTWKSSVIPGSGSGMYYEGKVIWYLLPVCQTIVAGDVNGDCIVNFKDFAIMALHWLEDNTPVNANSIVDVGIQYYVQTDKNVYHLGESVEMLFRITNLTDEDVLIGCSQSPEFNLWVQKDGETIWMKVNGWYQFSPGITLPAGEFEEITYSWDMKDHNDDSVEPAIYDVVGVIYNQPWNYVNHGSYTITEVAVPITIIP
jgi:hypothetical protein